MKPRNTCLHTPFHERFPLSSFRVFGLTYVKPAIGAHVRSSQAFYYHFLSHLSRLTTYALT